MLSDINIPWVILAGGQATRMGGQDKGLVLLNNTPLIEYVYNRIAEQGGEVMINANRNLECYQHYAPVFADKLSGFLGPLGGMHAALTDIKTTWVGFVPCDSPNLPCDLLAKMYQAITPECEILVAHDGTHPQPVVCLIKRDILPRLAALLARGERKILLLYRECNTQFVDFSHTPNAFINLNTPEELALFGAEL